MQTADWLWEFRALDWQKPEVKEKLLNEAHQILRKYAEPIKLEENNFNKKRYVTYQSDWSRTGYELWQEFLRAYDQLALSVEISHCDGVCCEV